MDKHAPLRFLVASCIICVALVASTDGSQSIDTSALLSDDECDADTGCVLELIQLRGQGNNVSNATAAIQMDANATDQDGTNLIENTKKLLSNDASGRKANGTFDGYGDYGDDLGTFCEVDTTGTCSFFDCDPSRGATSCIQGKCICKEGWCVRNGRCVPTAPEAFQTDTGGSCTWLDCDKSRGETTCTKGKCICKPGYFAAAGKCHNIASTGGSCLVFNCNADRGPTDCLEGSCICKPGFFSVKGVCVQ